MNRYKKTRITNDSFLEDNNELFEKVQKLAKTGSWKYDIESGTLLGSKEAAGIYGLEGRVFQFKDILAMTLPEDRKSLTDGMYNLVESKKNHEIEYCIKRANDGEVRYIHTIAEYEPDKKQIIGIIQDITERKRMERALSTSERRYRSIFDNSVSGIIYMDLDGSILEINRRMLTLFDCPSEEETKKINMLTFPLLVDAGISADIQKAIDTCENVFNFVHYKSKWGTEHYMEYYIIPLKNKDTLTGIMAKIDDVTERKNSEEKIESLLKEKDIILREVHHRIKNNMASMEGLLKLQVESSNDNNVRMELKDAIGRLSSMRVLYEKLYQSEDFMETSSEAYLNKLIDDIAGVFPEYENVMIEKKLEDFMIPSDISFSLGIIINELLTNAMKYAFVDVVREKLILISAKKTGSSVNITVRDNGIGFPSSGPGSPGGFGLQLIKMLSEQIGGKVDFFNDNGAVFSIDFNV